MLNCNGILYERNDYMSIKNVVEIVNRKLEKYEISRINTNEIIERMDEFHLHIVVVGSFSAGKSALLNCLIGEDILSEGQRPETVIPSELVYDENEYVELFKEKKEIKKIDIKQAKELLPKGIDADYLRWHLHRDALEELRDFVLVDMPGFNSGIEAHNKALLRYVNKANAYLMVIDAHDGGIHKSQSDFLREICHYKGSVIVAVSKSDLVIEKDLLQIIESIKSDISLLYGENIPVIPVSKKDTQSVKQLVLEIKNLDYNGIFDQCFSSDVKAIAEQTICVLNEKKKNINYSKEDLEKEREKNERDKKNINIELERELERLQMKYSPQAKQDILNEVQIALENKTSVLARGLKQGGIVLNSQINSIIRPVLVTSIERFAEQSFDSLITAIGSIDDGNADQMTEEQKKAIYKTVTAIISIATDVINPLLEIVIMMLPDLIQLLTGTVQETKRQQELETKVRDELIPSIIAQLTPTINDTMDDLQKKMAASINEQYGNQIEAKNEMLNKIQDEENKRREQADAMVAEIEKDIEEIRQEIINAGI